MKCTPLKMKRLEYHKKRCRILDSDAAGRRRKKQNDKECTLERPHLLSSILEVDTPFLSVRERSFNLRPAPNSDAR